MALTREGVERKVAVTARGCWEWPNVRKDTGHPRELRKIFELYRGPLPAGMVPHHLCHNPPCVNPLHLRAISISANKLEAHAYRTGQMSNKQLRMARFLHRMSGTRY